MATARILIVDDEPANLHLLTGLLRPEFLVRAANSGEGALRVATPILAMTASAFEWTASPARKRA